MDSITLHFRFLDRRIREQADKEKLKCLKRQQKIIRRMRELRIID